MRGFTIRPGSRRGPVSLRAVPSSSAPARLRSAGRFLLVVLFQRESSRLTRFLTGATK